MEINVRDHENVKIVDLTGELETNSAPNLEKILIEFTKEEGMQVLINMENLDFASSAGLRVLLLISKQLKIMNGAMKMCGVNSIILEVFDISGFIDIFSIYENEEGALESFSRRRSS
ncbi:MAG: STAS domain-containing protein [Candidatus Dadabacteria bacterium]|nr:STAS domain-containing protein [Candidatus Dadabacteria bacterium]